MDNAAYGSLKRLFRKELWNVDKLRRYAATKAINHSQRSASATTVRPYWIIGRCVVHRPHHSPGSRWFTQAGCAVADAWAPAHDLAVPYKTLQQFETTTCRMDGASTWVGSSQRA